LSLLNLAAHTKPPARHMRAAYENSVGSYHPVQNVAKALMPTVKLRRVQIA